jgi:NAD(P)-dependent dehydrogenase (short-subunit alcohol dehydrogenase family)
MDRLSGKVAIVTGGASGIGRVTALLFAAEGAAVGIGDIDATGGQATVAEIEALGGRALFVETDVSSALEAERLVAKTVERLGAPHVLHNNAYWATGGHTVLTLSEDDWSRTLGVCLTGMFFMSRYAIPHMLQAGGGSIVNMASAVALMGSRGNPAYAAAKGAVISFTKALAIDFGKDRIRVNCVAPGSIATAANAESRKDPRWAEFVLEHTLLARTGLPDDIAQAVLYLASAESAYVTGTTLVVDGGATSTPNWGMPRQSDSYGRLRNTATQSED